MAGLLKVKKTNSSGSAYSTVVPKKGKDKGRYQWEIGYDYTDPQLVYYPDTSKVNVKLKYPGAPDPSVEKPTWKPPKKKQFNQNKYEAVRRKLYGIKLA